MNALCPSKDIKSALIATMHQDDKTTQEQIGNLSKYLQQKGINDIKIETKYSDNKGKLILDYYSPTGVKQTLLDTNNALTEADFAQIEETINSKKDK